MYTEIPQELKELRQWCCFKLQLRNGKTTKIPIDAHTGDFGKSNDESTWSDFNTALAAVERFRCDGIGFYFKSPYFGIDLDDVEEEIERYLKEEHKDNLVSEFIETMESYAEKSVSGTGIHIIAKGSLPAGGRRKGKIEMYDSGRFFVMTGNRVGRYQTLAADGEERIKLLHAKYLAADKVAEVKKKEPLPSVHLSENELIEIASKSKTGMRFKIFMNGGWEQFYQSQSDADMAFANDLAFWTNRDFAKMDSIFRQSSLYRDKWDEARGDSTYGALTLNKAIDECTNVFFPQERQSDFQLTVLEEHTRQVKQKYFSYDDTGNAQRFFDAFGSVVRYSYIQKNWYYYNGKVWVLDQEGMIKKLVDKTIEKMKNERLYIPEGADEKEVKKAFEKHVKSTRSHKGKTNMLKESEHLLPVKPETFDRDISLFNVQNGYLNLNTGELHEHEQKKYFTRISYTEFTDKIDCPLWLEFLEQIFDQNQELINYIQRAVGYSLSGSTEEQIMFILHGNGRNGKSVFLDVITEIFGSYATNIRPQSIMVQQNISGANNDIARLDGSRFVTTTEPNEGVRLDEGLIKQLTGGDKVTARFLYKEEFEFVPQFKLWMATNYKPIIRGTDEGIWRRLAIIPFTIQIPKEKVDKTLKYKLKKELKAILNWAVQGYMMWKENGLQEPEIIARERNEYRTEMDVVESFLQECCDRDPFGSVSATELYRRYRSWAMENNQYVMSNTKFGREMSKKFLKRKSSKNIYAGLCLKNEGEQYPFQVLP